jgi:hypothetical protein
MTSPAPAVGRVSGRLQPLVVELVGPAGAGKSSLARRIGELGAARQLAIWGLPRLLLLRHGALALPTGIALGRHAGAGGWPEIQHMIRVNALHELLADGRTGGDGVVVLDEGPVFALSWLRVFGRDRVVRSPRFQRWRRDAIGRWARLMRVVVLIDAPDAVLAQRIDARPKAHVLKGKGPQEVSTFTAGFRAAFDEVVDGLAAEGSPVLLRLGSDGATVDALAAQVLRTLEEARDG